MCIINHDGKINNTNFLGSCDRASWTVTFTVHTPRVPAPHNHSHHYQCRTPYGAVHTLVLLMMGIMMPETCWDKSLMINIRLVASCWFLSSLLFLIVRRVRKIREKLLLTTLCLSVRPSVCAHGTTRFPLDSFHEFWCFADRASQYNLSSNQLNAQNLVL